MQIMYILFWTRDLKGTNLVPNASEKPWERGWKDIAPFQRSHKWTGANLQLFSKIDQIDR